MHSTLHCLLVIVIAASLGSCAKLPDPVPMETMVNVTVPEFTGGPKTPEIEAKKTALVAEYRALARAEARLDRERMDAMADEASSTFGGPFGHSTPSTQRTILTRGNKTLSMHQNSIAQLRRELTDAGVIVTIR